MVLITVTVLGVGTPFTVQHVTTSFVLSFDDFEHNLLVEVPDRFLSVLDRYGNGIEPETIEDVYISHIHGDHVNGLEGLGFWNRFVNQRKTRVVMGEEVVPLFRQRFAGPMNPCGYLRGRPGTVDLDYYFEITPVKERKTVVLKVRDKPVKVEVMKTLHCTPTYAIKVEYKGKKIGYSSDTLFSSELIRFLEDCDMIIHEIGNNPAHTSVEDLANLPETVLSKVYGIHYPDYLPDLISTGENGNLITLLSEGQQIRL